ncbi:MAG: hypothetical protein IKF29_00345 [Oceanobacillus sp.]|nr:hypothetical protein [Oceanobacillus sp.]
MNKEKALNELKRKIQDVEDDICILKAGPEDMDADTIGNDIVRAEETINALRFIESVIENWPKWGQYQMDTSVCLCLEDLVMGLPLTPILSPEDAPDGDWDEENKCTRWPALSKFNDKLYYDVRRVRYYDILKNRFIGTTGIDSILGKGDEILPSMALEAWINENYPIKFPYNPKNDRLKVYIEILKSPLQEGHPEVKTICIQAIQWDENGERHVEKVMRFFDVCQSGTLDEIDRKTYATRWQIYHDYLDKKEREAQIKAAEEITEKGITDPAEKADILNAARKEVNNDEDNA